MKRFFQGSRDDSAIIVQNMFPDSNLIISTPLEFSGRRSGVYIEGDQIHLEKIFEYSKSLINIYFDESCFGRWIGITPPEDEAERVIIHYEALTELDKLQLLSFLLPKHLAKICDLCLSLISHFIIKANGKIIQSGVFILPEDFANGKNLLSFLTKSVKYKNQQQN